MDSRITVNTPGDPVRPAKRSKLSIAAPLTLVALITLSFAFGDRIAAGIDSKITAASGGYSVLRSSDPVAFAELNPGEVVNVIIENHTQNKRTYKWSANLGQDLLGSNAVQLPAKASTQITITVPLDANAGQTVSVTLSGLPHEIHAKVNR